MISLIIGLFLGMAQIGSSTWRTVQVVHGKPLGALAASLIISVTYYFSISFVMVNNLWGYLGFSIGATLITTGLAYYHATQDRADSTRNKSTGSD